MISNKKILKYSGIILGLIAIPSFAVAGFFVLGNADRFRQFSVSPQNDSVNGAITAYRAAIFAGAEVIMAPGFTHLTPIETAVKSEPNVFNKTGFLLFDEVINSEALAALQTFNITYRADLGSLQTGVAAAYFLNTYQDKFASDGLTYSVWGGLPFASVTSFMGGLQRGIDWANVNLAEKEIPQMNGGLPKTYMKVDQIYGDQGTDFTGGFGPSDGIAIQQNIINKKADLIMPVAGPQIFSAQNLILTDNTNSLLLGVDSAVEDDPRNRSSDSSKGVGNGKIVQFSSLKNLRVSGLTALELINNGNRIPDGADLADSKYDGFLVDNPDNPGEKVGGIGVASVGNMNNGAVGVSKQGETYSKKAIELSGIPPESAPWFDEKYDLRENMSYIDQKNVEHNYFDGIKQFPKINIPAENKYSDVLDLKNFITPGLQSESGKIKIVLSSATSILLDSSFSQSAYLALADFMTKLKISVPYPSGFSPTVEA